MDRPSALSVLTRLVVVAALLVILGNIGLAILAGLGL